MCKLGDQCEAGHCVSACQPDCKHRECGDDGCGGSCGECGPCEQCISHHCKPIPDCVAPDPGPEVLPDQAEPVPDSMPEVVPDQAEGAPDLAEDVTVGRDVPEVMDAPDQAKPDLTEKDQTQPPVTDAHKTDKTTHADATPPDTARTDSSGSSASSGGCTSTGRGAPRGLWLFPLLLVALFVRRFGRDR